ncbi:AAA family ATPase [Promineifilum sp.]|uniref:ATP-binding protein n=1 Tax=Promineifilum sp. TaxID=2664178 RepID=UPI0035B1CC90
MLNRAQLQEAIAVLSSQRAHWGEDVVATTLNVLAERLAALPDAPGDAPPAEQRKQATILFATLEGFTRLTGAAHNTEPLRQIDLLWRRLDETILYHGGMVDKHMGDVVMGVFGVPAARENDPERAVRCALAIREMLSDFLAAQREASTADLDAAEPPKPPPTVRIGINTGPVSLGQVGSDAGQTAIGDAVNVASRLKEAAAESGVYVSHDTYRLVGDLFRAEALGQVSVKGRQAPITVYRIVGSQPREFFDRVEGVEGVAAPMIGRAVEMEVLQETLREAAQTGRGRLVVIAGDAGVGKSRLMREFNRSLEAFPFKVTRFQGRTDQRLMEVPYSLLRDLLLSHFGIDDSDRAATIEEKLVRGLAAGLTGADSPTRQAGRRERARMIGHLVGLDLPGAAAEPATARERALESLLDYFGAVADLSAATLVFLEDVHWADDDSLDFLERLAALAAARPLVVVCLARPALYERRPGWPAGDGAAAARRLPLRPLGEAESHELVLQILHKLPQIPSALSDLIVRSAAGNPFYVEELIRVLIEDRVIVPGERTWQLRMRELPQLRVPPTLTGVLQARLDRLPELERTTLQQAAVVGDEFWDSAVQQLNTAARYPFAPEQVAAALGALERRDMIYRAPAPAFVGSQAYRFKHAVLREVAYESVLLRDRPGYHVQAARWLETQSGDRAIEYAAPIAQHHEQAGQLAEAARQYERAAARAAEQYKLAGAIDFYHKALRLLERLPQDLDARLNAQERLGRALLRQGRLVEALYTFHAMQRIAELDGNLLGQARAENALAALFYELDDAPSALAAADRAEQLARLTGAEVELARALFSRAEAAARLGRADEALEAVQGSVARSRALDAPPETARALALLSELQRAAGRTDEAERAIAGLLALAERLEARGDRQGAAFALTRLGRVCLEADAPERARPALERALALARTADQGDAVEALLALGQAVCRCGDADAGMALLEEADALAETTGSRYLRLACRLALAEALLARDQLAAAEATVRAVIAAAENAQQLGGWVRLPAAYGVLGEVLRREGRGEEAAWAERQGLERT